jgi:hypothetical protein
LDRCCDISRDVFHRARGQGLLLAAGIPAVPGDYHLLQKSAVGGSSVLHFVQGLVSAFPHFAQKLFVEGLFVPHLEQRIGLPTEAND